MVSWTVCNTTAEYEHIKEDPILGSLTFHTIGLILAATFAFIAVVISNWLIFMHATHYSKPWIQRHIIRILFMIPVYAIVSVLSYMFYRHAIYFQVLRDCYEAFAIASFFTLLCHYKAENLHDQKEYFRSITPRAWIWPVNWFKKCCGGERGIWRTPRSGLTWFNIIWVFVFQYCFIRVFFTIVSVATQAAGRFCATSLSPAFAHIWVQTFEAAAVTLAMYCLIQFYIQLRVGLAEHSPFLKILSIKLVIFLSFWQTLIIDFLTSSAGPLKASKTIDLPDFQVGFPSMLLCIEMALFSVLHIFAFPYKPFLVTEYPVRGAEWNDPSMPKYVGGPMGIKAYIDAYNPWDMIKAVGRAVKWLFVGMRNRHGDSSYNKHNAPAYGVGLEPTNTTHLPPPTFGVISPTRKTGYQHLSGDGDEDGEGLLEHVQSTPQGSNSAYNSRRPSPTRHGLHDVGEMPVRPDDLTATHPTPGSVNRGHQTSGIVQAPTELDTSYHGAQTGPAIIPPPTGANHPQGGEWNMWAGGTLPTSGQGQPPAYDGR